MKYVAFYLPQFHPIPENDAWWGKGFTEWTNVTKAVPLFEGHYQPHLPADFGFYDLRVRDVQREQIACARQFGIDAFCFHYYWFDGRRLLERPVDDFLADPAANIDFCLCWANENWSRRWDGSEHEILMEQSYSPENDVLFIESLFPFFQDPRYLRVHGAPVLIVYCPQQMPDARATAERWRRHCRLAGIGDIHIVAALTQGNVNFERFGFDAGVEFPPHNISAPNLAPRMEAHEKLEGLVFRYGDIAECYLANEHAGRLVYRGVFPSWDNTARVARRALITLDASPENYERWLSRATALTAAERSPDEQIVFINAWNEWAEGCHLEPDRRHGSAFLEATLRVKSGCSSVNPIFPAYKPWLSPKVVQRNPRAMRLRRVGQPGDTPPAAMTTREPDLRIVVDGRAIYPTLVDRGRHVFILPAGRDIMRLVSRAAAPCDTDPWHEDCRQLGVMVSRMMLRRGEQQHDVAIDDPDLADGWWDVECNETMVWRWTDGDAGLPGINGPAILEVDIGGTVPYPVGEPHGLAGAGTDRPGDTAPSGARVHKPSQSA